MTRIHLRGLIACLATVAIVVPLAWLWQGSHTPSTYSVMDMGYVDYGGGPALTIHHHGLVAHTSTHRPVLSVPDLDTDPGLPADVLVDLVAQKHRFTLAPDLEVDGYALNGSSPGPLIEAAEGDVVEVSVATSPSPTG